MILLKLTRNGKRRLILGALLALVWLLAGTPVDAQGDDLISAAKNGDLHLVNALLAKGANVNAKDEYDLTALIFASQNGHLDIVQLLLAKGAEVNAKAGNGATALIQASQEGHLDVVQELLDKGAEVNDRSNNGWTALILASQEGYLEVVRALLTKGAEVNAKSNDGGTALYVASHNGHLDVALALLAKGAEVNAKDKGGRTALMAASQNGHFNIVQALLSQGADVNAKSSNGWTALAVASQNGHSDVVQALLSKSAGPDAMVSNQPVNDAAGKAAEPPSPSGEGTIYVYRTGSIVGALNLPIIYIKGDPLGEGELRLSHYVQARVPQGTAYVASTIVRAGDLSLYDLAPNTKSLAPLSGCAGLDLRRIWALGLIDQVSLAQRTQCENALHEAVAEMDEDQRMKRMTVAGERLCGPIKSWRTSWSGKMTSDFYIVGPREFSTEDLTFCESVMNAGLAVLAGTLRAPPHIELDVEAGKTYYLRWSTTTKNLMKVEDAATGAKDIRKLHPAPAP